MEAKLMSSDAVQKCATPIIRGSTCLMLDSRFPVLTNQHHYFQKKNVTNIGVCTLD